MYHVLLVKVETDKATMDMETPSEGFLAKILVEPGIKDLPLGKVNTLRNLIAEWHAYM